MIETKLDLDALEDGLGEEMPSESEFEPKNGQLPIDLVVEMHPVHPSQGHGHEIVLLNRETGVEKEYWRETDVKARGLAMSIVEVLEIASIPCLVKCVAADETRVPSDLALEAMNK